jgi:hypothetical protein
VSLFTSGRSFLDQVSSSRHRHQRDGGQRHLGHGDSGAVPGGQVARGLGRDPGVSSQNETATPRWARRSAVQPHRPGPAEALRAQVDGTMLGDMRGDVPADCHIGMTRATV